jgi:uncharacterized protein (UPF0548 family)
VTRLVTAASLERRLAGYATASLTYPERGATRGPLPDGYRHLRRQALVGHGEVAFEFAARLALGWDMHRAVLPRLVTDAPVAVPGATVVMCAGVGPVGLVAACRVVWVLDEPDRQGFGYGTLPDHPEAGEEAFVVAREPDDAVTVTVTAFSRPHGLLARLAGPAATAVQDLITARYLHAVVGAVGRAGPAG